MPTYLILSGSELDDKVYINISDYHPYLLDIFDEMFRIELKLMGSKPIVITIIPHLNIGLSIRINWRSIGNSNPIDCTPWQGDGHPNSPIDQFFVAWVGFKPTWSRIQTELDKSDSYTTLFVGNAEVESTWCPNPKFGGLPISPISVFVISTGNDPVCVQFVKLVVTHVTPLTFYYLL